jgi:tetratricopeptide (TPR) repeat protein
MVAFGWLCAAFVLSTAADPAPQLPDRTVHWDAKAHWELANIHFRKQRDRTWGPGPALTNYSKAIEVDPFFVAAYLDRGLLYCECGDVDKALADYNAAARLLPQFAGAFIRRGELHLRRGDDRKALADFDAAVRLLTAGKQPVAAMGHAYTLPPWEGLDRAYARRCLVRLRLKDRTGALADLDESPKHLPERHATLTGEKLATANLEIAAGRRYAAAWVLATDPDAAVRDGKLALELANRALAMFPNDERIGIDAVDDPGPVWAAVYAELGQFTKAVESEQEYCRRVQEMAWIFPLWASVERRGHYLAGRPWRQRSTWHLAPYPERVAP